MSVPFRPLGLVKEMLAAMGLESTYVYEDLVFVSHNAFLLQFGEKGEELGFFLNRDCPPKDAVEVTAKALAAAANVGLRAVLKGKYELSPNDDETFSVKFQEDKE